MLRRAQVRQRSWFHHFSVDVVQAHLLRVVPRLPMPTRLHRNERTLRMQLGDKPVLLEPLRELRDVFTERRWIRVRLQTWDDWKEVRD